ncbi:hypothetical protein QGN29_10090 [Temperatibacter marinus]|uniref:N-acetyltransferase domain-containing protein n=1 Tax=Temperatibacter marinus TaxID=1456591 RepID=A0AA52EH04_9PROT|nr:hypothetical protein [Temperatibacter marinus]WND01901.1 hypothetical protein QGN29_10090 [Temperatibacter marinus]
MSTIQIERVESKKQLKRFISVQYEIYKDDPAFIKPLMFERLDALTPGKNPYFEHADHIFYIAVQDGRDAGTISAQIDSLAQEKWGPNLGHFGLFEAANEKVAKALFAAAENWLSQKGMKRMQGPWNLSPNEQCGMLADGFDTPPMIMMPHGRPDYTKWTQDQGFEVVQRMFAYGYETQSETPEKIKKIAAMADKSDRVTTRQFDMSRFDEELALVLDIFNDAWENNWGFVPMTSGEIAHMAKSLKPIVKPYRTLIAELDGEAVAFIINLPDINSMIKDLDGKLFPFGVFKLIKRLFLTKNTDMRIRTPLMGMRQSIHGNRLGMAMLYNIIEEAKQGVIEHGGVFSEFSWILEDNKAMNNMLTRFGGEVYKTYHIYEKAL